ncbi:MAG: DUF3788 domain-containing protein [Candidatus Zixiibacteriota bacterium]
MSEERVRLFDGSKEPNPRQVASFVGARSYKRWKRIGAFIDKNYPGVFSPEWLYGGKKYGWGLRYKKSKSFCTLIPEKNQFRILIVFGGEERAKVEATISELVSHAREDYVAAKTYADGKWLGLLVDSDKVLADVERLLLIKRRPKRG